MIPGGANVNAATRPVDFRKDPDAPSIIPKGGTTSIDEFEQFAE
jgi:hypothetical protein